MYTLPTCILADLDGTLADVRPVRHHVKHSPRDFEAFHQYACTEAQPNADILAHVQDDAAQGHAVLYVIGRHERWRDLTVEWLKKIGAPDGALHMRGNSDFRPDTDVKREIHDRYVVGRYHPVRAYDGRPTIVALWRSLAIPVVVVPGWDE